MKKIFVIRKTLRRSAWACQARPSVGEGEYRGAASQGRRCGDRRFEAGGKPTAARQCMARHGPTTNGRGICLALPTPGAARLPMPANGPAASRRNRGKLGAEERHAAAARPPAAGAKSLIGKGWGERRGSNPRHSVPQTDALPAELRPPSGRGCSLPGGWGQVMAGRRTHYLRPACRGGARMASEPAAIPLVGCDNPAIFY